MNEDTSRAQIETRPEGTSPTFVATFADGEITRMTTFQSGKTLNLTRGVRLAHAAYESRMKKAPPPIVEGRYERDGEVLESYGREQLETPSKATPGGGH